ncbi:uncharacterized protein LOC106137812 [Amyelois transitella]|uniref:uncharacterized protein LOC106137812 n=1 Tax=Amyelois transitella TaxID=680683 RepID=UPI00299039AB|nr:uncharacterized protein LOC106137812 [Amyelois transitella]
MPLTQENRLDSNFSNNNDQSYLHKKFKKMASTISVSQLNTNKALETRQIESDVIQSNSNALISNGSIAAAHPEIEKIKENPEKHEDQYMGKIVQTNCNVNARLSNVINKVQVSGQTSFTDEFSNKTEHFENDFIKDASNGTLGGRYVCPYCKLSCAKPSVLQKHIRAHTNERPYPCVPCGFAFKTKSNLYKHRRSRTHALRLQGSDVNVAIEDESGGSESDTSLPPTSISDTGSDSSLARQENFKSNELSCIELSDYASPSANLSSGDNIKSKSIYKPKFRVECYQESDEKDKAKKTMSPNAEFLTEHISKIISDNEAIVDVTDTPLQKKYGKIKQMAESKQLLSECLEIKQESTPLNLTKNGNEMESSFRKRSHSESFSHLDLQKHPLNPEGSIIKDLLLKTKSNCLTSNTGELIDGLGPLFICPLCQIVYRSADNLEIHRLYYCKGNLSNMQINSQKDLKIVRPENVFVRSNSINVRLPEATPNSITKLPLRSKPDNLVITKTESNEIVAPLPSPGPLLGNTRLVDTRTPEYTRKSENVKIKSTHSPKRRIDSRSETYSPRLIENISPRTDLYPQAKIRCVDGNTITTRSLEDISHHMRTNSTSLQMFGGEVKIVNHSGGTTTLRIEPSKNQLSPILIQQSLSPSKLTNETEASSIVVRSGLQSGGTMVHNPPTPKELINAPQTPRMSSISTSGNLPRMRDITHFQFPPLSAITAYNPLTLPPLSPSSSPSGATTILHGGKLIPHVPGIPGPNTPGVFQENPISQIKHDDPSKNSKSTTKSIRDEANNCSSNISTSKVSLKYDISRNTGSPVKRLVSSEFKQSMQDNLIETPTYVSAIPIIKVNNVEESCNNTKSYSAINKSITSRQEVSLKRNYIETIPRTPVLKENTDYPLNKLKVRDIITLNVAGKCIENKTDEVKNFNFENLITKVEIFNNQMQSSTDVQKNEEVDSTGMPNERSETSYFQKNITSKATSEERKPKFLRPSTLPLKPGTFTPKRHHGITPNANTMPLVSPETPRPAKAYGQLYLNGNAYTYLGLKCSTKVFYCTINRPQPTYVPNQHFLSMYSNWQLLSELTPDPLGLSTSIAMSLYDSRHRPQKTSIATIKQDLILTHSSKWNKNLKEIMQTHTIAESKKHDENKLQLLDATTPKKELAGGFESNEEYTYVRGRGRGRYVCSECGIRCKKPSMLKKHIRTHTDVRPYTCTHCAFSFKTKGNLTKHMKSKAHYKKCCELGINPNEDNDGEGGEMMQCSGETDDDTESDGDEGNEGETESSDTEACKSRLPEHEAAHCLLSLGGSRPTTTTTPGLITSARPSTYPYTPVGLDKLSSDITQEKLISISGTSVDSGVDIENEPMDLSKNESKPFPSIPEIPTARESSVLASLASNTAKLPQHQTQWSNGEPMLHTYLTERALLDSKIKQSQLTSNLTKLRKIELDKSALTENNKAVETNINISISSKGTTCSPKISPKNNYNTQMTENDNLKSLAPSTEDSLCKVRESPLPENIPTEMKKIRASTQSNSENAKYVVSEYLKQARLNMKLQEENFTDNTKDDGNNIKDNEDTIHVNDVSADAESLKLPTLDHDPVARKVVIGVGGVAFKVSKGKEFENASFSPGRLMEDGRRVCDFCNKTFTKPSQLRLHLNIHYMERPFRCSVCAVSFRTRGHLQKHERSGSHHNKVSMTSTFGAATSFNPRPFRCSDCNIAFRIHGHLAKHLRSKMHVMRLECLFKLPFGTFTEIERAGVSLTDIDTTDCASSLASLQSLAQKLHERDPTKLDFLEGGSAVTSTATASKDSSDDEETGLDKMYIDSERDSEKKTNENIEGLNGETRVNCSATDN